MPTLKSLLSAAYRTKFRRECSPLLNPPVAGAQALGIDQSTTQVWVLADNTVATPTVSQLAQALKLAGEAQTALWTVPYQTETTEPTAN